MMLSSKFRLNTLTHTNVFCDDRVFITAASSVSCLRCDDVLDSSEERDICPDELTDRLNSASDDRVLCSLGGTLSASFCAVLRRSVNDRDIGDLRSPGTVSVFSRDGEGMSADARRIGFDVALSSVGPWTVGAGVGRGLRTATGDDGADGGRCNSSVSSAPFCCRLLRAGQTYSMMRRPTRVSIWRRIG